MSNYMPVNDRCQYLGRCKLICHMAFILVTITTLITTLATNQNTHVSVCSTILMTPKFYYSKRTIGLQTMKTGAAFLSVKKDLMAETHNPIGERALGKISCLLFDSVSQCIDRRNVKSNYRNSVFTGISNIAPGALPYFWESEVYLWDL